MLICLVAKLKELNKLADPRVVDLERDKHWGRTDQIRMVFRKGRSNSHESRRLSGRVS